jgi:hypothetical protein
MDKFWNTKEGKILSYGIHDHSHGLSYISNGIAIIKRRIENKSLIITGTDEAIDDFNYYLDFILKGKTKCKESIDYIYSESKKLRENE